MTQKKWDPEDIGCIALLLLFCGVILIPVLSWWAPVIGRFFNWVDQLIH